METLFAEGCDLDDVVDDAIAICEEGYEAIVDFGPYGDPDDVVRVLRAIVGDSKFELQVRHAEFGEVVAGATSGGLIGTAAAALLMAGSSVVLPGAAVLGLSLWRALGLGLLLGGLIGGGSSYVHTAKIYKYRGSTRLKLLPN